jgi:hypothetical protein
MRVDAVRRVERVGGFVGLNAEQAQRLGIDFRRGQRPPTGRSRSSA